MRPLAIGIVVAAGLAAAAYAFGDENFDHAHPGGIPAEEVVVPGADGQNIDELAEQYARALERVQTAAAPTPTVTPSTQPLAEQVSQFPWPVLDSSLDADGDGLSAADEVRLQTNARQADTDGDGYMDGLEFVRGYNPLVPSPGDKIDFGMSGVGDAPPSAELRIMDVRIEEQLEQSVLVITGLGPPNGLLTVFVFSEKPRVVVLRADETGRFRVVLDDTLPLGNHRVYVVWTDAAGAVQQASEAFDFERTAEGIVSLALPASPVSNAVSLPGAPRRMWVVWAGLAAGALAGLASVGLLAWWRSRRARHEPSGEAVEQ